jgi:hypothetical protein
MIKSPSDKLFALSHVNMYREPDEPIVLHPDATFLFNNTQVLELYYFLKTVDRVLELFGSSQLQSLTLRVHANYDIMSDYLLSSMVRSNVTTLDLEILNIEKLFLDDDEKEVAWPRLTELSIFCFPKCKIPLQNPVKLYQNLRKLELFFYHDCQLFEDDFKNVSNLEELKIANDFKFSPNCFHGLVNLRVLELRSSNDPYFIQSFDMLSCLLNLEELDMAKIMLLTPLVKFPSGLLKLKLLQLEFVHAQCIAPTAFDHLVHLEQLIILNDCYKTIRRNMHAKPNLEVCHHKQDFETGAPALRYLRCDLAASVKFNTKSPILIEEKVLHCQGPEKQIKTMSGEQPMTHLK